MGPMCDKQCLCNAYVGPIWGIYGVHVGFIWAPHGACVVFLWYSYGVQTGHVWDFRGGYTGSASFFYSEHVWMYVDVMSACEL